MLGNTILESGIRFNPETSINLIGALSLILLEYYWDRPEKHLLQQGFSENKFARLNSYNQPRTKGKSPVFGDLYERKKNI